ncbi:hypothetical protein O0I10_004882 [Lichtheimia ornata]|uniref:DNA recombination and repair protein Rad51-like C-terminal domain-containing protein n=1 Tax=Lichtheimia ornata TaxID=688661 RepID=A0AAD7V5R7_9FUNG|nr:uncharacterized protein O0I10_004882 [Lichtheimia ornata]KAJ8659517.1 hypothetical protein O0I10_004882 [Lichtheimia ornata]
MRKLKVLLGNHPIYSDTITTLANNGITTDLALLKADLDDLSKRTSIPTQRLHVLRHKVATLSVVPETNKDFDQTRFSTGFQTLDHSLHGGFCLGHTIEVTGLHRVINAEFSLYAVESFLSSFDDATVHYIYTTGMADSRQMEAVISRAQAKHKRHKSDQIMQRIQCYSVVTPTDACQLLVQIGALHLSSPSTPSLIVMSDIVHLLESEWSNNTTEQQQPNLAQSLKSVNNLGLSTLVLHTITGDPNFEKPRSMKAQGLMEQWNSAIDIRLLLAHGVESAGTVCKVVKARSTKISNQGSLIPLVRF